MHFALARLGPALSEPLFGGHTADVVVEGEGRRQQGHWGNLKLGTRKKNYRYESLPPSPVQFIEYSYYPIKNKGFNS